MKLAPRHEGLDCGPATAAVVRLLDLYAGADWFAPATSSAAEARAVFARHHALAHALAPDLFVRDVQVSCVAGGEAEFRALCEEVRGQPEWDWKYGALKVLGARHSERHDFRARALRTPVEEQTVFMVVDQMVFWRPPLPQFDGEHGRGEVASFYKLYADMDVIFGIEWQLADPRADLEDNPFLALVELYATGHYPFHVARDRMVLMRFEG